MNSFSKSSPIFYIESNNIEHMKKLYRSRTDRIFGGLCGGLGEYLNVDSSILRLLWLLVVIFTGVIPGIIFYLVGVLIVPVEGKITP